jgi:chromosome segregation ATPase
MLTGTDQLAIINRHIDTTRSALDTLHQHKEAATQQLVGLRSQMTEAYRQLASFRLDELAAGRVVAHLEEVDRATLELLKRREQAMQALEPAIAQCASRLSALNAEREQAVAKRDALVRQIDERAAEIRTRLSGQEVYQAQERLVAETAGKAERAEGKAAQAEADQAQKGQSYRADPLFMYLWERRYLTPDYRHRGLTRRLDGWVAGLIRYADARGNYYLLTELPLRLREHAQRQKEIAEEALTGLRAMEAEALNTEEMVRDQAALAQVRQALDDAERHIEEEEARHDALLDQRSQFSSGTDDISRQAIDLQVSEIKDESVATLYLQAKMTPKPDDDLIVSRIRDLQQEEQRIQAELDRLESQEHHQRRAYQDLEDLRQRYRRSGYDSNHSYFPSGFDLVALLALVLSGKSSGRDAWDRIDREQQFRRPRTPRDFGGGRFPGGFGGGFRTGGGFGGGRGGGGFRTGGRF